VAIFFRHARFSLVEQGHFWLSDTPDTPGSKGWDARHPRMVTWCTLRDVEAPGELLHVLNTHFAFYGETARQESAKLLRCRIETLGLERSIIVMGDFNCGEDDLPYRTLLAGENETPAAHALVDAYRSAHVRNGQPEATRHDFGRQIAGPRIDWIFHSRRLETLSAGIDRTEFNGRFPSDHYPVTAVLRPVPLASSRRTKQNSNAGADGTLDEKD
jgi:endonuclease/exonuclease/phosphatase family metal-dependent hydrolase